MELGTRRNGLRTDDEARHRTYHIQAAHTREETGKVWKLMKHPFCFFPARFLFFSSRDASQGSPLFWVSDAAAAAATGAPEAELGSWSPSKSTSRPSTDCVNFAQN